MGTSIKLNNDIYWDATGVEVNTYGSTHNPLSALIKQMSYASYSFSFDSASDTKDFEVTFNREFTSPPIVIAGFKHTKSISSYYEGSATIWVVQGSVTTTGCRLRAAYYGSGNTTGWIVQYIAIDSTTLASQAIQTGNSIELSNDVYWDSSDIWISADGTTLSAARLPSGEITNNPLKIAWGVTPSFSCASHGGYTAEYNINTPFVTPPIVVGTIYSSSTSTYMACINLSTYPTPNILSTSTRPFVVRTWNNSTTSISMQVGWLAIGY